MVERHAPMVVGDGLVRIKVPPSEYSLMVEHNVANVRMRVRFSLFTPWGLMQLITDIGNLREMISLLSKARPIA